MGLREVWRRLDELVGCIDRKLDAGHRRPLVELVSLNDGACRRPAQMAVPLKKDSF
jgi:hypothetical protein